jgi:ABC-type sulfate transport system permease component
VLSYIIFRTIDTPVTVPTAVYGTILLLYSNIGSYLLEEFVIGKAKRQLAGCPVCAE